MWFKICFRSIVFMLAFVCAHLIHIKKQMSLRKKNHFTNPICTPNIINPGKYGGIAFDAYGTLLDVSTVLTARAKELKLPNGFVTLWRQKQLNYSWLRAAMKRYVDFWDITMDSLDYTLEFYNRTLTQKQKKYILRGWYKLEPFPEVKSALDLLKKNNQNLYILSNGTPRMLSLVLFSSGLRTYFKSIVSVESVKTFKPNPKVYALLEESVCVPRDKLLFVSGNSWDAAAGKSFGFKVASIQRDTSPGDRLGYIPDFNFTNLLELAKFIQNL